MVRHVRPCPDKAVHHARAGNQGRKDADRHRISAVLREPESRRGVPRQIQIIFGMLPVQEDVLLIILTHGSNAVKRYLIFTDFPVFFKFNFYRIICQ